MQQQDSAVNPVESVCRPGLSVEEVHRTPQASVWKKHCADWLLRISSRRYRPFSHFLLLFTRFSLSPTAAVQYKAVTGRKLVDITFPGVFILPHEQVHLHTPWKTATDEGDLCFNQSHSRCQFDLRAASSKDENGAQTLLNVHEQRGKNVHWTRSSY